MEPHGQEPVAFCEGECNPLARIARNGTNYCSYSSPANRPFDSLA